MNCAFEDCLELDRCIDEAGDDWARTFALFFERRKPNADAIADMALENYVEMRDSVRDPAFLLANAVAFELERRYPERFRRATRWLCSATTCPTRRRSGAAASSKTILNSLTEGIDDAGAVDYERAGRLIAERLEPLPSHAG
jgi:kynurenine 3-monooxygenase